MKGIIGFLCECRAGLAHHFNYHSSWEHGKSTNTWIPVFCTQALFPMAMLHCRCMKWFPVIPLPLVSTCWICRWRTSGSIYRQQNEVPKSAHSILLWCSLLIFFFFFVNLQLPWWVQSTSKIYALAGNLEQNEQLHQLQKEGKKKSFAFSSQRSHVANQLLLCSNHWFDDSKNIQKKQLYCQAAHVCRWNLH